ncbi:hypothetical protein OG218_02315 [Kineococcus sp. NBC_00420]|uniref:hypothetical protein n=1 Tax=Kineococcus sp. NBC_00420 TaxID=2903564 RepID=UPI002E1CD236
MPLWLWLPLVILVFAVITATIMGIGDSLGWPHWAHTLVSGGSFAIFALTTSPRITRAQKSFKERRRLRKAPRP